MSAPRQRDPKILNNKLKKGQTPEAATAEFVTEGLAGNILAAMRYSKQFGELDVTECFAHILREAEKVRNGDHSTVEGMLAGQAVTLNAIFGELSLRARDYLGSGLTTVSLSAADTLLRLAFRAQSQCRLNAEALTYMKNPCGGAVFTRQANFANGPQQVNNAAADSTRAPGTKSAPNELLALEGGIGESMDSTAPRTASARDSFVATVGQIDGAAQR